MDDKPRLTPEAQARLDSFKPGAKGGLGSRDPGKDYLVNRIIIEMSCDEQLAAAKRIAANVGYQLIPEDSIQEAEDSADISRRLDRLEQAVLELNPGLNWA